MSFIKEENESTIKEGKANRVMLLASQGGNLHLSNKRIVFVSHKFNLGKGTISIDLKDILTYGRGCTFNLFFPIPIPNAIKIITRDGNTFRFTVYGRKKWIAGLEQIINQKEV